MTTLYTAEATATGAGRGGHVRSTDAALDLALSIPAELGGAGGAGTNPEQLFAAGFAACFHSALQVVARREKVALDGTSVTGAVGIGPDGAGYG
ncbi:Ohr family peroxiredoxin, partial [Nocardia cyriacigeorgica]